MVPGPRFRDNVMKVALPVRTNAVAELQTVAPPPKNIAPVRKVADDSGMVRRPNQVQPSPQSTAAAPATGGRAVSSPSMAPSPARGLPPTRVSPPMVAEPIPNRGVNPQPALPGNEPAPLAQPPKFNRVPPTQIQTTPPSPRATPDIARPQPRARMPQENLPQAQQNPRVAPAEPARFPPGAPPTVRQPKAPMPAVANTAPAPVSRSAPMPVAPPVQRAAPPPPAPSPVQRGAPPPAPPTPRAEPPRQKEAVRGELSRSKQM